MTFVGVHTRALRDMDSGMLKAACAHNLVRTCLCVDFSYIDLILT